MLEGFGYKSSLMNWKPGILKMELRDKEQVWDYGEKWW